MRHVGMTRTATLLAAALLLAGCSEAREQFSLTSTPPDEFRVTTRAPLAIPPDLHLRPPAPGQTRPQEGTASQQAKAAVFRASETGEKTLEEIMPEDGRTRGERALLMAAGAAQAEPQIRQIVERERELYNADDGYLYDALVFWRDEDPTGDVIDAAAEARRLRENAALGKSVTEGETPTIERKKKALLEGIF